MINPIIKDNNDKIWIIFRLVIPLSFNILISSLSIISIKKKRVPIRKINGNISNKTEGAFRRVKYIGNNINSSLSLKKPISSIRFIIIITDVKTIVTFTKETKNF